MMTAMLVKNVKMRRVGRSLGRMVSRVKRVMLKRPKIPTVKMNMFPSPSMKVTWLRVM